MARVQWLIDLLEIVLVENDVGLIERRLSVAQENSLEARAIPKNEDNKISLARKGLLCLDSQGSY